MKSPVRTPHPFSRAITRNWYFSRESQKSLRLRIPLKTVLKLDDGAVAFSPRKTERSFVEGFTFSPRRRDDADYKGQDRAPAAGHQGVFRTAIATMECKEQWDPVDGGAIFEITRLEYKEQSILKDRNRFLITAHIDPVMNIYVLPWCPMPRGCDLATELDPEGALFDRAQDWTCNRERRNLQLVTQHYTLDLVCVDHNQEQGYNFAVKQISRRHKSGKPSNAASSDNLFLAGACFKYHSSFPFVIPPELLVHNALLRFHNMGKSGKGADAKPERKEFRFTVADFRKAGQMRKPIPAEVKDLNPLDGAMTRIPGVSLPGQYQLDGFAMLDFPWQHYNLTIAVCLKTSPLTGRPWLEACRIRRSLPHRVIKKEKPPTFALARGALQPYCRLVLDLQQTTIERRWPDDSAAPDREEILSDLAQGYALQASAETEAGRTGSTLLSKEYFLVVRPDKFIPREPWPGCPVRAPVVVNKSKGKGFRPQIVTVDIEEFAPARRLRAADLEAPETRQKVEQILNEHYYFSSIYSQILDYRDSGTSNSRDDRDTWRVNATLCGIQDVNGHRFPVLPERVKQQLVSEKARLLIRLNTIQNKGVFVDGVSVGLIGPDGAFAQYAVDVVVGDFILLVKINSRSKENEVAAAQFSCPFDVGANVDVFRLVPGQNVNLKRQIDSLRNGKSLAASQEIFSNVVTTPNALEGAFEPAREVDAIMARNAERDRSGITLNKEQKIAVSKAARTPHAFFIKGPPGTGKTRVISKLAEVLAAKGERILLSSAQNKPLTEAIDRMADSYGVIPARITSPQREGLSDAERETIWDNLVETLRAGLFDPDRSNQQALTDEDRMLRQDWNDLTGLGQASAAQKQQLIDEVVKDCMLDVNLYAININSIAARLHRKPSDPLKAEPDFRTAFDTLIIDEASRVNDAEFVTAALRCRKWILVGDER